MLKKIALFTLLSFSVSAAPADATTAAATTADGRSCFLCDDYMQEHFVWRHTDYFYFLNDLQGTNHGVSAEGSCSYYGHNRYDSTV